MQYYKASYEKIAAFCKVVYKGYGFSETEAERITDVLLAADLSGIESHGIQRMVRYHKEITGNMVHPLEKPEILRETPISALMDGHAGMGQLIGIEAMNLAVKKAKNTGFGIVTVKNSNHYGIAGYYAKLAAEEDLIGLSMTNTEAIMVPTNGKVPKLGTNPIAFAMPASPNAFCFDAATTVVPRGKLEVYVKRGNGLPLGWALDETGHDSDDADRVLKNIIAKTGGGILPLGGSGELHSGYKGYGFALLVEIMTSILSGGTAAPDIYKTAGESGICHCFIALDYGMFGDKAAIEQRFSAFLQEIRDSEKAEGEERIYVHGEKEWEARERILKDGIPFNEKTYSEMKMIAEYTHTEALLPEI